MKRLIILIVLLPACKAMGVEGEWEVESSEITVCQGKRCEVKRARPYHGCDMDCEQFVSGRMNFSGNRSGTISYRIKLHSYCNGCAYTGRVMRGSHSFRLRTHKRRHFIKLDDGTYFEMQFQRSILGSDRMTLIRKESYGNETFVWKLQLRKTS